jgi:hypothetical protein
VTAKRNKLITAKEVDPQKALSIIIIIIIDINIKYW